MSSTNSDFFNSPFTPKVFFVPDADDPAQAEYLYTSTNDSFYDATITHPRIQRIDYTAGEQWIRSEVGEEEELKRGKIMAIFGPSKKYRKFYITTLTRGMLRGNPIMIAGSCVRRVYAFLPH
ncbi:hypothetical protein [Pseudarthrobacter sp. PS3-L1]|uniref:hypothetical protein n=1 Tax=Pseudarthrobacter sp. PS3-L1 TaxID=3046207 RepID=UPI0024B8BADC|nr:hypothetical protein [Pseudarthrobacter sp. PS3-L1]MDJ0319006.1 hypothetical protein [Pseudarthrobacter sp. PS3-L1]